MLEAWLARLRAPGEGLDPVAVVLIIIIIIIIMIIIIIAIILRRTDKQVKIKCKTFSIPRRSR